MHNGHDHDCFLNGHIFCNGEPVAQCYQDEDLYPFVHEATHAIIVAVVPNIEIVANQYHDPSTRNPKEQHCEKCDSNITLCCDNGAGYQELCDCDRADHLYECAESPGKISSISVIFLHSFLHHICFCTQYKRANADEELDTGTLVCQ